MQTNTPTRTAKAFTHEGAKAAHNLTPIQQLRRSVMACLLWEDGFYEDGQSIGERIRQEAADPRIEPRDLMAIATEARNTHNLRHVPLLVACVLAQRHANAPCARLTIEEVIQRPDELSEFLSLYWRAGKQPLAAQVKKGLAAAFRKFDAYQLGKYNRDRDIKLRDVMFLVHPKPADAEQAETWKQLANGTLPSPDTWEVNLSAGADKKETFERLLREGKLGYMALLRNLRGMYEAGVDARLIRDAILARKGAHRVLPFRFVAAARACPMFEPELDAALRDRINQLPPLTGRTVALVDVSASMRAPLSSRSDLTRMDAAAALSSMVNANDLRVISFSNALAECAPRRGMAGVDAVIGSQGHGGTDLAGAVKAINAEVPCERLIVITDEQAGVFGHWGRCVPDPAAKKAYMINVASYQNGVGYGRWTHIDGFSENVLKWIYEFENED